MSPNSQSCFIQRDSELLGLHMNTVIYSFQQVSNVSILLYNNTKLMPITVSFLIDAVHNFYKDNTFSPGEIGENQLIRQVYLAELDYLQNS